MTVNEAASVPLQKVRPLVVHFVSGEGFVGRCNYSFAVSAGQGISSPETLMVHMDHSAV